MVVPLPSGEVPRQGFGILLFDPQALSSLGPPASLGMGAAWPSASYTFLSSDLCLVSFPQSQAGPGLIIPCPTSRPP